MADVFLAVLAAALVVALSALGIYLSAKNRWHTIIAAGLGVVAVILVGVQAARTSRAQEESQQAFQRAMVEVLSMLRDIKAAQQAGSISAAPTSRVPPTSLLEANTFLVDIYPDEWENYAHKGSLISITDGVILRNPYRGGADNPYRLTPEIGHRNQDIIYAAGTEIFVSIFGGPQIELLPRDRKYWIPLLTRHDVQQWYSQIPSPIKPSPPGPKVFVAGVDQSIFLKTPLAPGKYRVEYSFRAMTLESQPIPITKQASFHVEIYCPVGATCK